MRTPLRGCRSPLTHPVPTVPKFPGASLRQTRSRPRWRNGWLAPRLPARARCLPRLAAPRARPLTVEFRPDHTPPRGPPPDPGGLPELVIQLSADPPSTAGWPASPPSRGARSRDHEPRDGTAQKNDGRVLVLAGGVHLRDRRGGPAGPGAGSPRRRGSLGGGRPPRSGVATSRRVAREAARWWSLETPPMPLARPIQRG